MRPYLPLWSSLFEIIKKNSRERHVPKYFPPLKIRKHIYVLFAVLAIFALLDTISISKTIESFYFVVYNLKWFFLHTIYEKGYINQLYISHTWYLFTSFFVLCDNFAVIEFLSKGCKKKKKK